MQQESRCNVHGYSRGGKGVCQGQQGFMTAPGERNEQLASLSFKGRLLLLEQKEQRDEHDDSDDRSNDHGVGTTAVATTFPG